MTDVTKSLVLVSLSTTIIQCSMVLFGLTSLDLFTEKPGDKRKRRNRLKISSQISVASMSAIEGGGAPESRQLRYSQCDYNWFFSSSWHRNCDRPESWVCICSEKHIQEKAVSRIHVICDRSFHKCSSGDICRDGRLLGKHSSFSFIFP